MGPRTPLRADFRFLEKLYQSVLGGKVEHVPDEFDLMSTLFQRAGGSWERVFLGSPGDVDLLKRLLKLALKKGKLTKKFQWGKGVD